jgi:hypothetical protein
VKEISLLQLYLLQIFFCIKITLTGLNYVTYKVSLYNCGIMTVCVFIFSLCFYSSILITEFLFSAFVIMASLVLVLIDLQKEKSINKKIKTNMMKNE